MVCFVGKGTGVLNIKCEAPERMISSGTCNITDGIFCDTGANDNWTKTSKITRLAENNLVSVINTSSTGQGFYFANILEDTFYDFDVPLAIEFDLVSYTENSLIFCSTATEDGNRWFGTLNPNPNSHIKIIADGGNISYYVNGTLNYTKAFVPSGKVRIGFRLDANATLDYKNFVVYPI